MITARTLVIAFAALALILTTAGCSRLQSRDNLNKGVREYKSAKYADAVKYFQKAIELDPEFSTARLYLATAKNGFPLFGRLPIDSCLAFLPHRGF